MGSNSIVKKAFVNRKTGQLSVVIPKKKMKAMDPSIKFNKDIFVELEVMNKHGKTNRS